MTRQFLSVAGFITALLVIAATPSWASVADAPDQTVDPGGTLFDVEQVGDLTIVVGAFTRVAGKVRNRVAAIRADGSLDPNFQPSVNGTVYSVEFDGSRIFLGGSFTSVSGQSRNRLAAVDTTGSVLPWRADVSGGTNPHVRVMEVSRGHLYVGGKYTNIAGEPRSYLTAVDAGTAALTSFAPQPDGRIVALAVSPDGARVYAGGYFKQIAGVTKPSSIAELDAATGEATSFAPNIGTGYISALEADPNGINLYAAHYGNKVFSFTPAQRSTANWVITTNGDTQDIAASSSGEIYFGGHWPLTINPVVDRQYLASVTRDGRYTSWNPQPGPTDPKRAGEVWAVELTGSNVLVGGKFSTMGGDSSHRKFARFPGSP